MPTREEILTRARKTMHPEVLINFEKYLPGHGPHTEDMILDAIWSATGDFHKAHPVKILDIEFISPVLEFEIGVPERVCA